MMSASPFDKRLKYAMLTDAFHIVGVPSTRAESRTAPRRDVLLETKEEFDRAASTNFTCVYPNKRSVVKLDYIFESKKTSNDIIKHWLLNGDTGTSKKSSNVSIGNRLSHGQVWEKDEGSRSTISSASSGTSGISDNSGISYY